MARDIAQTWSIRRSTRSDKNDRAGAVSSIIRGNKKWTLSVCFTEPSSLKVLATELGGNFNSQVYKRYVDSFGLAGSEWVLDCAQAQAGSRGTSLSVSRGTAI